MLPKSASVSSIPTGPDVYAPGHVGELTQIIDPVLVDAVIEETAAREQRLRLLPARVVVYFVLALAFFERSSYQGVWGKLTVGLGDTVVARPCASSLSRARRRLGVAPLRALFTVLAGPVATPAQTCAFYRGRRVVAIDGTTLNAPDEPAVTWRYPKHIGPVREFGYPIVRLVTLVECGTRALIDAVFGPDRTGEISYAHRLLGGLDGSMLLLADAYYDAVGFLTAVSDAGAAFLLRSTRKRRPTIRHPLPDGSYRTFIQSNNYRAGRGYPEFDSWWACKMGRPWICAGEEHGSGPKSLEGVGKRNWRECCSELDSCSMMRACTCGRSSGGTRTGRWCATSSSPTTGARTARPRQRCWSTSAARTAWTSTACAAWSPRSTATSARRTPPPRWAPRPAR
ncbi:IS4 family transposase [Streptomyces sp. DSM 41699]|uniref:IS4 family transposase n=1 Tax=Streptomyces gibsoniae TaxID=3075529 RepID=A0ABU2U5D2_9ACTN|nr:IS4 family transposase [Streptomyces sp. DSM 41699]MDT0468434.1 IS4 family transposase [Streptomyces sp. DSM 41699]